MRKDYKIVEEYELEQGRWIINWNKHDLEIWDNKNIDGNKLRFSETLTQSDLYDLHKLLTRLLIDAEGAEMPGNYTEFPDDLLMAGDISEKRSRIL